MDKSEVEEVFSVLNNLEKDMDEKQKVYCAADDMFKEQREKFEQQYKVKRSSSLYSAYVKMLKTGKIASVRDTLKTEFIDFAKCIKSSKTIALCSYEPDAKSGKRMLTMGKFGLGQRYNMKSKEISVWDVEKIAKNSVELVKALKEHKKVLEAEALEKFFSDGVGVLLSEDDRSEIAYEEVLQEPFKVMEDSYEFGVITAAKIRASWDGDGEVALSLIGEGDEKFGLESRYSSSDFKRELTVPYLMPMMEQFVRRAREHLAKEKQKRETLVQTATAPLMPYLMARRL